MVAVLVVLSLTGCSDFFTMNLFDGMDKAPVPSKEDLNADKAAEDPDGYLDSIGDSLESGSLVDAILEEEGSGSTELKETALGGLQTIIDSTDSTPVQKEEAALSFTEVVLKTKVVGGDESGAGSVSVNDMVNNIEIPDISGETEVDPATVVTGIFKDSNGDPLSTEDITAVIETITSAESAMDAFAGQLVDDGQGGYTLPEGSETNLGEVSQQALIILAVSSAAADDEGDGDNSDEIAELVAYIENPDPNNEPVGITNLQTEIDDPASSLNKILSASGYLDLLGGTN
jgi:hypothetical protein